MKETESKENLGKFAALITIGLAVVPVIYANGNYDIFDFLIGVFVLVTIIVFRKEIFKSSFFVCVGLISSSISLAIIYLSIKQFLKFVADRPNWKEFTKTETFNEFFISTLIFVLLLIAYKFLFSPKKTLDKPISNSSRKIGGEVLNAVELKSGEHITTFGMQIEEGQKISKEIQNKAFEKYQEIENFRGWLISETNIIEKFLKLILGNSLFTQSESIKKNLFNELILDQRFFTLKEKKRFIKRNS